MSRGIIDWCPDGGSILRGCLCLCLFGLPTTWATPISASGTLWDSPNLDLDRLGPETVKSATVEDVLKIKREVWATASYNFFLYLSQPACMAIGVNTMLELDNPEPLYRLPCLASRPSLKQAFLEKAWERVKWMAKLPKGSLRDPVTKSCPKFTSMLCGDQEVAENYPDCCPPSRLTIQTLTNKIVSMNQTLTKKMKKIVSMEEQLDLARNETLAEFKKGIKARWSTLSMVTIAILGVFAGILGVWFNNWRIRRNMDLGIWSRERLESTNSRLRAHRARHGVQGRVPDLQPVVVAHARDPASLTRSDKPVEFDHFEADPNLKDSAMDIKKDIAIALRQITVSVQGQFRAFPKYVRTFVYVGPRDEDVAEAVTQGCQMADSTMNVISLSSGGLFDVVSKIATDGNLSVKPESLPIILRHMITVWMAKRPSFLKRRLYALEKIARRLFCLPAKDRFPLDTNLTIHLTYLTLPTSASQVDVSSLLILAELAQEYGFRLVVHVGSYSALHAVLGMNGGSVAQIMVPWLLRNPLKEWVEEGGAGKRSQMYGQSVVYWKQYAMMIRDDRCGWQRDKIAIGKENIGEKLPLVFKSRQDKDGDVTEVQVQGVIVGLRDNIPERFSPGRGIGKLEEKDEEITIEEGEATGITSQQDVSLPHGADWQAAPPPSPSPQEIERVG